MLGVDGDETCHIQRHKELAWRDKKTADVILCSIW